MALQWMDGFDHYGGISDLTAGIFAEALNNVDATEVSTANPRTGTKHFRLNTGATNTTVLRRIITGSPTVVGVGSAFWFSELPSNNAEVAIGSVTNTSNQIMWTITLTTQGELEVRSGDEDGTVLATSDESTIVPSAYQHIEIKFDNSGSGEVEVRVNENVVVTGTGSPANAGSIGNWVWRTDWSPSYGNIDLDDLFCWDNTGSTNNDYLGDRKCIRIAPDGDTATADYTTTGAASGWDAIDDTAPDDDTSYIEFDGTINAQGEFDLSDVTTDIENIAAVMWYTSMKKTDAGTSNIEIAMGRGGSYASGADRAITTSYIFYEDVFESDPATSAQWTPANLNSATLRYERTA